MRTLMSVLVLAVLMCSWLEAKACTVMLVGKQASADGSVIVAHSNDGFGEGRMIYVPAKDHKPGAMRPVYYSHEAALDIQPQWGATQTHCLVDKNRAPAYGTKGDPVSVPLGYIPEVGHTYAYFDSAYGIMNEHQLSIGEATDKAKVAPEPKPGKRIFYSAELSRVALERCKTAREAVLLMGSLIERYGFYGTGETLLVGDPNEGWIMEMCGYDKDGTGAVWAAQRLSDDQFFVAANQFRIRDIRPGAEDLLYSSNIFNVAKAKGWWKPEDGELDWTSVYGDGEFDHPYYSLRRVWRALSLVASSLNLPAWVEGPYTRAYPFSVKPEHKLSVQDIIAVYRDNYQGTEFDLTAGLAGGPFGDPNRFEGGAESLAVKEGKLALKDGAFERPINNYNCAYMHVAQSRNWLPDTIGGVCWFGEERPSSTVMLPYYVGVSDLPGPVQRGDAMLFDRGSLWTAFNFVANQAQLLYSFMIKDITAEQARFESRFFGTQQELEGKALALWKSGNRRGAKAFLTKYAQDNVAEVLAAWWKLSETLYVKYNNGNMNTPENLGQPVFYPVWWLKAVGYEEGLVDYQKPAGK